MPRSLSFALLSLCLTLACGKAGEDAGEDAGTSGNESSGESGDGDGCGEGLTRCGEACVDTQSSDAHCGGCEASCGVMYSCFDGQCQHNCDGGGGMYCSGSCVYVEFDDAHCGGCDNACVPGTHCEDSACVDDDPPDCSTVSETQPAGDPDGPYGSCAVPMDCNGATTCFTTCGGICAPACDTEADCPGIDGYTPACVDDDFGTGTCQLACDATDECPAGMLCSGPLCAWPD